MRKIFVQGEGRISKSPDTIELNIEVVTLNSDYNKVIKQAINKINLLTFNLTSIGFDKSDIQTSSFIINAKYENVSSNNGNYKNVFTGYEARQKVVLAFPLNNDFLGETLSAITRSVIEPNISINFTIKDDQAVINDLLEQAVADAINKANVLANASKVKLGEIQTIEYETQNYKIYSKTKIIPTAIYSAENFDIVPEDIELTGNVNISFLIV